MTQSAHHRASAHWWPHTDILLSTSGLLGGLFVIWNVVINNIVLVVVCRLCVMVCDYYVLCVVSCEMVVYILLVCFFFY